MLQEKRREIAWLKGEIKTPPFSEQARREAGFLLRALQKGETLGLPHSRPMPSIGPHCHELRINDTVSTWRIIYAIHANEVIVLEIFAKRTQQMPHAIIDACQKRLRNYIK